MKIVRLRRLSDGIAMHGAQSDARVKAKRHFVEITERIETEEHEEGRG